MIVAFKVSFYDGDIQNGGHRYFINEEEAQDWIDELKEELNGWNSDVSEPEEEEVDESEVEIECPDCGYDRDFEQNTLICRHCGLSASNV
jgi:Zn finger protein HypA/HybF involved in hydrogenase expression